MFQSFETLSSPEHGAARLNALREMFNNEDLNGFIIPRADAHQGEYVAPHDERLQWLTGFTGSAGFCCALEDSAGVFIDGRYRTQVKAQVDLAVYTPVPWPETSLTDWLRSALPGGGVVGFDPWLMTQGQLESHSHALSGTAITLRAAANLVDRIWDDQPAPPDAPAIAFDIEFAGKSSTDKRDDVARDLKDQHETATVLTLPDSICWLLNLRGNDVPRTPLLHSFAIVYNTGRVTLFVMPEKMTAVTLEAHIDIASPEAFDPALRAMTGRVRLDKSSVPVAVVRALEASAAEITYGEEPCALPKARKNPTEIAGTRQAHHSDAIAMVELLSWLDAQPAGSTRETEVVSALESHRRASNGLRDISFDTIAGSGPNGAIMHYRVTHDTDRVMQDGDLLVLDSGGQYLNGTTDITRTIAIGTPGQDEATAFTRVLQGMIAMSRLRFPRGLAGRDIESTARMPLWLAGQDFDHGVGHGVGHYLSVHEGPQRLSRTSHVPLEAGMILSNEPGYYREGAFGIRIENLIVVQDARAVDGGDAHRKMLDFETLTYVPLDRRLIRTDLLSAAERDWLNRYHGKCRAKLTGHLSPRAEKWLVQATAAL
jgi:Xaa-Pro aminopeptidase